MKDKELSTGVCALITALALSLAFNFMAYDQLKACYYKGCPKTYVGDIER